MTQAIAAHLRACEEALLDPAVRSDRARVDEFLAKDFQEFGASGRLWSRTEILDELAYKHYVPPTIEGFHCVLLADTVALVTYRTVRGPDLAGIRVSSLRSSIWTKRDSTWELRFHQGTRMP
jgi:hypothetical protein